MNNTIQESYFIMIPLKYRRSIERLSNEETGKLFKTLMAYGETKEEPDIEDMTISILFDLIKGDFDVISNNYKVKCEKQAQKKKEWWEKQKVKEEPIPSAPIQETVQPIRPAEVKPSNTFRSIPDEIYDMYNEEYVPDLPACLPQVKSQCIMRIASLINEGWKREDFIRLFDKAKASPFLRGDISDWQCSLIWLLNDKNYPKVLSGNYDGTGKKKEQPTQGERLKNFEGWEIVDGRMEYAVYDAQGNRTVTEVQ